MPANNEAPIHTQKKHNKKENNKKTQKCVHVEKSGVDNIDFVLLL